MRSLTVTAATLAMCALGLPSAQALPLSQNHAASRSGVVLVAQKTPEDDSGAKSKSKRAAKQRGSSKTAAQDTKEDTRDAALQGSRAPGTSIQMSPRGGYLYGPSFNGAYTPPGGYSMNGYPVRYADEPSAAQAECAPLRRRAMSSGQRSAWDRYYACMRED